MKPGYRAALVAILAVSFVSMTTTAFASTPGPDLPPEGSSIVPTSPATLQPDATKPATGNSWIISPKVPSERAKSAADFYAGICRGQFFSPQHGSGQFDWGVYQACTSPVSQQVSVRIDKCVRNGGPDDFNCTYANGSAGSLVVSTYVRTTVPIKCKTGTTSEYRPDAYYIMVDNRDFPAVIGSVQAISC